MLRGFEKLMDDLQALLRSLLSRISALVAELPPGTLQLTGVLGLAAVLVGYYQIRGADRRKQDGGGDPRDAPSGSGLAGSSNAALAAAMGKGKGPASAAAGIRSKLKGVNRITISAPGVLLEEWTPQELEDSATLRPDVAALLREMCSVAEVYIMTHVTDDIGEATVRGALEDGQLLGTWQGQVKPHRVLFCCTPEGKASIVRQLEPDLHIDGHIQTVTELQRFIPQLLHIHKVGEPVAGPNAVNVNSALSLVEVLGSPQ